MASFLVPQVLDRRRSLGDRLRELRGQRAGDLLRDRLQRAVGGGEHRVECDVLDEHGTITGHAVQLEAVPLRVNREGEHAEPVIVGRPLGRREIARVVPQRAQHSRQVEPLRDAQPPRHPPAAEGLHPRWGRIEPALPRVDERDEARVAEHPFPVQPLVVGHELREQLIEQRAALRYRERLCDALGGDRGEGRLGDARRLHVGRRAQVPPRLPHASAADVVGGLGEDHVRQHAVRPLAAEQRAQLAGGSSGVVPGDPDGGEA